MKKLVDTLTSEFRFLIDNYDFSVIETREDPAFFNNALVVLRSPAFDIRITRDRGQRIVDIRRAGCDWHLLSYTLEFVDHSIDRAGSGKPPRLSLLADCLRRNISAVSDLFSSESALQALSDYAITTARMASVTDSQLVSKPHRRRWWHFGSRPS